ncbi:MAG: glycosyltransferase family 4 protein [Tannerella sp.]|nr:glycosyltransferase family 4 protein [Tannerella sp.]
MRILFIIPGAGDSFYCGNCFRDNLIAAALRRAGHDVIIMPVYLPLTHHSFKANSPLFFPATTFYVAQKFFGTHKMPRWIERMTSSKTALRLASSMSGATTAEGMESMTLSMITGDDPAFTQYINVMLDWIGSQDRPEVIHLSSSLLTGIAKAIRERFDIPVICSLQDEEVWIDSMNSNDAHLAWQGIRDNLHHIDRFVTTSRFYKESIIRKIPQIANVDVVYPCINSEKYASTDYPADNVIGFFYRMNRENGLDILAKAFVLLKRRNSVPRLKLKIGGGYTGNNRPFLKQVRRILRPFIEDVEISDSYNLDDHAAFYRSISVLAVPVTFCESVGLYLCEAFAAGRPAVEPDTGSFREIVDEAGLIYSPNTSEALADALEKLLIDKALRDRCTAAALTLAHTRYNEESTANKLIEIYNSCL